MTYQYVNKNNSKMDDWLIYVNLFSTSFYALCMPLLLHLHFLNNRQVLCRKSNFDPSQTGLHNCDMIDDLDKHHSFRFMVSLANPKGESSHILPLEDNK